MVEQNPDTSSEDARDVARAPRRGRRRWWTARAIFLLLAAPILMATIAVVALIGREVTAPSWVVRDVEARAADVLAGGSLDFGDMKVSIGEDLHPRLSLRDVVLRDAEGTILAQVPRVQGLVSPRGVLQGRVLAQEIVLSGAEVSLRRAGDGTVAFAFDQSAGDVGAADGFLALLDQVDQVFDEGALEALEQVRAEGLILNYTDARAKRSWVVDNGRIGLDVGADELALRANFELLSGRSYVTQAEVSYVSPRGSRSAEVGFNITDAAAPDIASQSPVLAWLGVLDAPISGAMRGRLDESGLLTSVSATLQMGEGELQPTDATRPIPFQSAKTYLTYDPIAEALTFDLIEIDSAFGRVSGAGQTYLREFSDRWPEVMLGHVSLSEVDVSAASFFSQPVPVGSVDVDFRLRLNPFTFEIGQAAVVAADVPVMLQGQVQAAVDGWSVALDATTQEVSTASVLGFWPEGQAVNLRRWLGENVQAGVLRDAAIAFRARPGEKRSFAMTTEFSGADVRFMRSLPPIEQGRGVMSLVDGRFAMSLDGGFVAAPEGGRLDMAGSTMVIPRTGPRAPARFDLALAGRITAAMSVLNLEPFNVLGESDLPVSFAQGQARIDVALDTPLGRDVTQDERVWNATARLSNVRSEALWPGQVLTSSTMQVAVDPDRLSVRGPVRMGDLGGDVIFARALGTGAAGTARLDIDTTIGPSFLRTFNIALPDGMVQGEGAAQITLDLSNATAPDFRLTSDLRGVGLSLAGVGWSKARNALGSLTVEGQLGERPQIDLLAISAPGLETRGTVRLAPGGGLERAAFERVRLGGWLDAPVILVGRGQGRAVEVRIAAGSLDLRSANFGTGGGSDGGPLDIALDRLRVTDNIVLDDFRGQFSSAGGFQGTFTGTVNGAAPVSGTIVPIDGRSAVRVDTTDAGSLLRATQLLRGASSGVMRLTLLPTGAEGSYDGTVEMRDLRVRDAPALASLLDAISVVGLLNQMDGQGLLFTDVDAQFRLTPNQVIVTQSSATGPSIGISLDGVYSQAVGVMDFQGVVSPLYLLNGIGSVLTRPGEGLIGFNFNLRGAVDSPRVTVNPLSALTPGMFRDIFRRPPPTVGQ